MAYVGGVLAPSLNRRIEHTVEQNPGVDGDVHGFKKNPESAQDVIANIRNILTSLGVQKPLFGVFQRIAHAVSQFLRVVRHRARLTGLIQLVKEFEVYSGALKDVKSTPRSPVSCMPLINIEHHRELLITL